MINAWFPLSDITSPSIQVGGVCSVYCIPSNGVVSIPKPNPLTGFIDKPLLLRKSTEVILLKGIDNGRLFSEKNERNEKGISIYSSFNLFVPEDSIDLRFNISQLEIQSSILIAKERNGLIKIVGEKGKGLSLEAHYTSGDKESLRGYQLNFYGKYINRSYLLKDFAYTFIEPEEPEEPGDDDYNNFYKVTINHTKVSGSPKIVVPILTEDIISEGMSQLQADSIRVYLDKDKTNEIPREIVSKDLLRVAIDLNSQEDTILYLYVDGEELDYSPSATYGREAVYANEYQAVFPEAQDVDSTRNNRDMSFSAGSQVSGKIGAASSFNGTSKYAILPRFPAIENVSFTIHLWVSFSELSSDTPFLNKQSFGGDQPFYFGFDKEGWNTKGDNIITVGGMDDDHNDFRIESSNQSLANTDQWYHLAIVLRSKESASLYIDGVLDTSIVTDCKGIAMRKLTNEIVDFYIGAEKSRTDHGPNKLNALFFISEAKNDDYIKTVYAAENDPSSFYNITKL